MTVDRFDLPSTLRMKEIDDNKDRGYTIGNTNPFLKS